MITWKQDGSSLIIDQGSYPGWAYTLIAILGFILLPIGAVGFIAELSERLSTSTQTLQIFTTTLLVFQLLTTLGIAMIYLRFSSNSIKNYKEKIIFNNDNEIIQLYMNNLGDTPYEISYFDISHVRTVKELGGPDYSDVYHIYLIKKDGAEYWITGFNSKPDRFFELLDAIYTHAGFAVKDSSALGTEKKESRVYEPHETHMNYKKSDYIKESMAANAKIIGIKPSSISLSAYFLGMIVYLFFLLVPLYIINMIISEETQDIIGRGFAIFFVILWVGILFMLMFISLKDYILIVNNTGVRVELRLKLFRLIKTSMFFPRDIIQYVRTNRQSGGACSLSLGVDAGFKSVKSGAVFFMNLGVFKKNRGQLSKIVKGCKEVSLWELPVEIKAGKGPTLFDLSYIEKVIQDTLRLVEKDISL